MLVRLSVTAVSRFAVLKEAAAPTSKAETDFCSKMLNVTVNGWNTLVET